MTIRDISALKTDARDALDRCDGQKQLALVYTAGLTGLSLLLTILDYVLSQQISGTGGLSQLGTRTILSTIQSMLPIVQMLLMLCWNAGYTIAVLNIIRRRSADHNTLMSGFPMFFPMLRSALLECMIYFNILILSFFLSFQIYMFTPWAKELTQLMEPLLPQIMEGSTPVLEDAMVLSLLKSMLPMLLIFCGLYLLLSIPISYRLRFSLYCLMDAPRAGALRAMAASRRMLRGNCWKLFRMDLGFWWYHGLLALANGIQMLPLLGLVLPQGYDFTFYLCYGVYLILVSGVYILARNRVECTYAAAYETLREKPQENAVVLGNIFDMQ